MSKKTIFIMNIGVIVLWLITGITTLLSGEVSKVSYGCCLSVLLLTWVLKTINDFRIEGLYDEQKKWFNRYTTLLNCYIKSLEKTNTKEENDNDN